MKVNRIIATMLLVTLCFTMAACAAENPDVLGVSNPTTPLAVSHSATQSDAETPVAYQNDFFGYSCVLPDEWYVLNPKEIAQVLNMTFDALGAEGTGKTYKKIYDAGVSKMDFYAASGDGTQTINNVITKATLYEATLPEKKLIEAMSEPLIKALADMGATNIAYSMEQIDFLGKKHVALYLQADSQGSTIYEILVVLRKSLYLSTLTVTGADQAETITQLGYYQRID